MADARTSSHSPRAGFVHEALIYRDEAELDAAVQAFLREAAAVGEPVLVALPGPHLQHMREALGEEMADARLEDLEQVGRNPGRLLSMIEEWVASHDGRARVVSEVVWPGRSRAEAVEALRHEALVNHALAGSGATILSPFDAQHLDDDILAGIEMTHPTVVEGGRRRAGTSYTDPMSAMFGELWPLEDPPGPVSEHPLHGSLIELRRAIARDPALGSLSAERRSDLVFAINEAASNAVKHGNETCLTRIWHDGDEVVTEVSSHSGIEDVMAGRRRPAADALQGRGLWLINQVCDLVELRSGASGTTLRMHIKEH
ncbi:MAG TPA: sensor histidine kinase [Solirubrobacteraceae bacterium]|nr:sensor histidine kinase [Solirubrobacteraceae bacterium]